ncbi:MAG: L-seryl-tRNA(Sec) selenium transferase [Thermovirgaceae bacterium]|nr:L-seryl-tRNA(Sec) selenium transferase [Thermovirgaceae bacterium]
MREAIRDLLRDLPSMDELLQRPWTLEFQSILGRDAVKSIFADVIGELRNEIIQGRSSSIEIENLETVVLGRLGHYARKSLRRVINATGVVVHTNLGRSCLSESAVQNVAEIAGRYSNLEYDLDEGGRGHRNAHVEWLLSILTGADAALAVNNNAGAVLLCLAALGKGMEVIVSRGELVEIGGSFRIPDIMDFSGAVMKEVGTTNRTHIEDYERAITPRTRMLLKVHPSNYRVVGFHSAPSREELARLVREKDLVLMEDLGSGVIADLSVFGLSGEPTVKNCIEAGVDLVTFSGDKLLGGPQLGAVVGRKQLIAKLREFPLLRALRVDKMTLAAFETTMRLYLEGRADEIPTLRMLMFSPDDLLKRAKSLARKIRKESGGDVSVIETPDAVGGGAFPATDLPGYGVVLTLPSRISDGTALKSLRGGPVPIVASARAGAVIFHTRTLLDGDDIIIARGVRALLEGE